MSESFQDDARENEMIKLFNLVKASSEGRSGIDAFLEMSGFSIPFELKTSSNGSVTTVRDFGPDHIEKWKGKHWLIGFYQKGTVVYKYGSPNMMKPWIDGKAEYIAPDILLADLASKRLSLDDLFNVCGRKDKYTHDDAFCLHKRQYSAADYIKMQDLPDGYSQKRMLDILKDRIKYTSLRGSTLNNPHIPAGYFLGWDEIVSDHANRLRRMVKEYLKSVGMM